LSLNSFRRESGKKKENKVEWGIRGRRIKNKKDEVIEGR
jgi:hypothetical protein